MFQKIVVISCYTLLGLIYTWVLGVMLVFHGPFDGLKRTVIMTVMTSQHPQYLDPLALYTLTSADKKIAKESTTAKYTGGINTVEGSLNVGSFENISDNTITVETLKTGTFTAKIMLINDPKRLKVAVTKHIGKVGQTVSEMVADAGAVAGVNGGSFKDLGWRGTGGSPQGLTIHKGQVIVDGEATGVIGFTDEGSLVAGKYSKEQLQELRVNEALSFGPVLVKDGKGIVNGDGGWGNAPRTAIGQKADGTIILIVTDGRFVHGPTNLGATISDMMDLMLKYEAVTAANLDGGSSTTMVKDGKLINQPSDVLGERKIATSIVVMPAKGE